MLTPSELATSRLWFPGQGSSVELTAYAREYARHVNADLSIDGANLGLETLVERLRNEPDTVTLVGEDWPVHDLPGVRTVTVRPVPLYPWWAVWRATSPHPDIAGLVAGLQQSGDPTAPAADVWLPAAWATHVARPGGAVSPARRPTRRAGARTPAG